MNAKSLAATLAGLSFLAACGGAKAASSGSSGGGSTSESSAASSSSGSTGSSTQRSTPSSSSAAVSSAASSSEGGSTGGSSSAHSSNAGSSSGGSSSAIDAGHADAGEVADAGEADAGTLADAGTTVDAGPADAGFQPAPRSDWPVFSNPSSNPVLDDVQLVTITFTGYPFQQEVQDFGSYLVGSSWFSTIGADYGVGSGSQIATLNSNQYSAATEAQISDTDIELWLAGEILTGAVPAPSASNTQLVYMLYFPASISISNANFGASCSNFDGYHSQFEASVLPGVQPFSYAVVVDCEAGSPDELAAIETTASHELAESATDPYPITAAGWLDRDLTSPWVASQYIVEIGDVCEGQRISDADAGFTMQQIWSVSAAQAGGAPCVPVDPNRPYFGVSASPSTVQSAAAGGSVDYTITGWSSGPIAPWDMATYASGGPILQYVPTVGWSANTLANGLSAQLDFGVPAGAGTASVGVVMLYSELPNSPIYSRWPLVVNEQ